MDMHDRRCIWRNDVSRQLSCIEEIQNRRPALNLPDSRNPRSLFTHTDRSFRLEYRYLFHKCEQLRLLRNPGLNHRDLWSQRSWMPHCNHMVRSFHLSFPGNHQEMLSACVQSQRDHWT